MNIEIELRMEQVNFIHHFCERNNLFITWWLTVKNGENSCSFHINPHIYIRGNESEPIISISKIFYDAAIPTITLKKIFHSFENTYVRNTMNTKNDSDPELNTLSASTNTVCTLQCFCSS